MDQSNEFDLLLASPSSHFGRNLPLRKELVARGRQGVFRTQFELQFRHELWATGSLGAIPVGWRRGVERWRTDSGSSRPPRPRIPKSRRPHNSRKVAPSRQSRCPAPWFALDCLRRRRPPRVRGDLSPLRAWRRWRRAQLSRTPPQLLNLRTIRWKLYQKEWMLRNRR